MAPPEEVPAGTDELLARPERFPGYRLEALLGRGSMGSVYRATVLRGRRNLARGQVVALKVLSSVHSLDRAHLRRFKREAGVGLGRGHVGIARVFEVGSVRTDEGSRLHYLVLELLEGRNLKEHLAAGRSFSEAEVRSIGLQVARTLSWLHARGIVHRDLKPANLFLDDAGQVKVVDFGLARLTDEEEDLSPAEAPPSNSSLGRALTSAGRFLGTVAYAAPEQLGGARATAESDLYALGLVLHELVAGVHPFAAELEQGFEAYRRAVTEREPPLLTTRVPTTSWFLDAVVEQLLRTDPLRRIRSADTLAEILEQGESSHWWREATSAHSQWISDSRRLLVVRRRTRLIGREPQMAQLRDVGSALLGEERRGAKVWIEGEAGIGKTRLVDQFARWLEDQGKPCLFLVAQCRGAADPVPLEPLRRMLVRALELDEAQSRSVDARSRLEHWWPAPAAERAALLRDLQEGAGTQDLPLERLEELYAAFLDAVAESLPCVLVVEAVHHADLATLRVLGRLESSPVGRITVLTARTEQEASADARPWLEALRRGARPRLTLAPLDRGQVAEFVRDLAVEVPRPDRVVGRLHQLTAGNPLFVLELVQMLSARGGLANLRPGRGLSNLPSSLAELVGAQVDALEPKLRAVVEIAAVLGGQMRGEVLRAVAELDEAEAVDCFAALDRARILVLEPDHVLRFRHGVLRHAVLDRMDPARRTFIHGRCAEYYDREIEGGRSTARTPYKAAFHAEAAGDRRLLLRHLEAALELLVHEGQWQGALQLCDAAIARTRETPRDPRALGEALVLSGRVLHRLGLRDREERAFAEAVRVATECDDPSLRVRSWHGIGRLSSRTGRFITAEAQFRAALEVQESAGDPSLGVARSLVLLDLAELLLWSGDEERCQETLDEARNAGIAGEDPGIQLRYQKELASLLVELGRFDEAGEVLHHASAHLRGPGRRAIHRALLLTSARLARETARYERAVRLAGLVARSARADGDLRHRAIARFVEGDTQARSGNPELALAPLRESRALSRRIRDVGLEVLAESGIALLYRWPRFSRHSLEKSVQHARRAIALAHGISSPRLESRALAVLALCYRDQGKLRWALAITRKAVREASASGVRRRRAAEMFFVHALVAGEIGKTQEAQEARAKARSLLEERLLGLAAEEDRARILERDPLYRLILPDQNPPASRR